MFFQPGYQYLSGESRWNFLWRREQQGLRAVVFLQGSGWNFLLLFVSLGTPHLCFRFQSDLANLLSDLQKKIAGNYLFTLRNSAVQEPP